MIRAAERAVFRSRDLPWPIREQCSGHVICPDQSLDSREIVCHNNQRRHWRQHIFSKKQYHMTFELIMDSKNIYKIKSQHHDGWTTSKVRPSTMKVCPRKCLIDRKSFKRVHFGARGLSEHFQLAPRLFLIRPPHQLKSVVIISFNDSGLTSQKTLLNALLVLKLIVRSAGS